MRGIDGNKIGRNSLCRCGSNVKYKNCCLEKERQAMTEEKKLSNEFRDNLHKQTEAERDSVEVETEKVGDAEMMRRDTHVTMRSLQVTKMVIAMDKAHTEAAIRVYSDFIDELANMPISEGARDIGAGVI